jgi:penicillin-binding protein 1A
MSSKPFIKNNTDSNRKKGTGFKKFLVRFFWFSFILAWSSVFLLFYSITENTKNLFGELPTFKELENPDAAVASRIYTADSVLLGKYFLENRTNIAFENMSPKVMNTLMATEDIRFHEHSGVDGKGVATIPYYLLSGKRRGSSTITQQLARNLYTSSSAKYDGKLTQGKLRSVFVKLKEWITATNIEKAYTKEEIITMYLNTVDFGSNAFGINVASQTYFGKDQKDLAYQESAVLIGLLKATNAYNPKVNPEKALKRRNTVLEQLSKYKFVSKTQLDSLKKTAIVLNFKVENQNQGYATYFREEAKKFLQEWCKRKGYDIYKDGLVIYSTIDSRMQHYAEEAVEDHLKKHQNTFFNHWKGRNPWTIKGETGKYEEIKNFLQTHIKRSYAYRLYKQQFDGDTIKIEEALNVKKKMKIFTWAGEKDTLFSSYDSLRYYKHILETGFMSMDPTTGYIKAWVGGINYKYFKYDHVKQGKRQPGSTFKPIVYTTIMGEIGEDYGPCFQAIDAPVSFVTGDTANPVWSPENSDGKYTGGTYTLRQALAQSKNSITAYMMKIMGEQTPQKVLQYATKMGINTEKFEAVPAMCLGTFDVSLYELMGAYATFMNKGQYQVPQFIRAIYDKNGNLIEEFKPQQHIAISEELAYVMSYMLRGATQERNGTALGLNRWGLLGNGNEIAAKTGTSQDYSDGWFMGMTPQLVTGCWVGCDDRVVHFRDFEYGQGARMAMPIFGLFMQKCYNDPKTGIIRQKFPEPSEEEKSTYKIITDCGKFRAMKSDSAMMKSTIIDPNAIDDEFDFQ